MELSHGQLFILYTILNNNIELLLTYLYYTMTCLILVCLCIKLRIILLKVCRNVLFQVKYFFVKYPDAGAGARGRLQALESIERNIAWINAHQNKIVDWLTNHAGQM